MRAFLFGAVAALALSGCTHSRTGRVNLGRTLLLGAGLGAGAGLVGSAIAEDQRGRRSYGYSQRGAYGRGYGYGGGW